MGVLLNGPSEIIRAEKNVLAEVHRFTSYAARVKLGDELVTELRMTMTMKRKGYLNPTFTSTGDVSPTYSTHEKFHKPYIKTIQT